MSLTPNRRQFLESLGKSGAALAAGSWLSTFGILADDLPEVAALAAGRPGNLANPKPATADEIEAMLRSIL